MKKYLAVLVFVLLLSMFYPNVVRAESCEDRDYQCIECSYDNDQFVYVAYSDAAGNVIIDEEESEKFESNTFTYDDRVKGADFINEEGTQLSCPYMRIARDVSKMADPQDDVPYLITASQSMPNIKDNNLEKVFSPTTDGPTEKKFVGDVSEDVKSKKTCLLVDTNQKVNGESLKVRVTYDGNDFDFDVPTGYKANIPRGSSLDSLKEEFKKDCSDMNVYLYITDDDDTGEKIVEILVNNISGSHKASTMNDISDSDTIDRKSGYGQSDDFTPGELCKDGNCDISIEGFCGTAPVKRTLKFIGMLVVVLKILVPVIIVGMGVVNLVKVIISGKDEEMRKNIQSVVKRLIVGVVIFLLPGIIDFVFDAVTRVVGSDNSSVTSCEACILDLENCK